MPLKNAGKYLTECLESIQKQSIPNWELIIVDDHSTDHSNSIVQSIQAKDQRIQLIPNEGTGIISALQTALKVCNGPYVTRMDSDDVMPVKRLELMISAINQSDDNTIVTGKVKYFGAHPISEGYLKYENWINQRVSKNDHWKWVYRECVIASPGWMVHRDALLRISAFENLNYPEDYHLVLKWYSSGFKVHSIPEVILNWREHPERISRLSTQYSQESFFELKLKHFIENDMKEASDLLIWGTNGKGKLVARLLMSWNVPFRWMTLFPADHPKKIYNKAIEHFELGSVHKPIQLLIAVYPERNSRMEMLNYLQSNGLEMGSDYWFL